MDENIEEQVEESLFIDINTLDIEYQEAFKAIFKDSTKIR